MIELPVADKVALKNSLEKEKLSMHINSSNLTFVNKALVIFKLQRVFRIMNIKVHNFSIIKFHILGS